MVNYRIYFTCKQIYLICWITWVLQCYKILTVFLLIYQLCIYFLIFISFVFQIFQSCVVIYFQRKKYIYQNQSLNMLIGTMKKVRQKVLCGGKHTKRFPIDKTDVRIGKKQSHSIGFLRQWLQPEHTRLLTFSEK